MERHYSISVLRTELFGTRSSFTGAYEHKAHPSCRMIIISQPIMFEMIGRSCYWNGLPTADTFSVGQNGKGNSSGILNERLLVAYVQPECCWGTWEWVEGEGQHIPLSTDWVETIWGDFRKIKALFSQPQLKGKGSRHLDASGSEDPTRCHLLWANAAICLLTYQESTTQIRL